MSRKAVPKPVTHSGKQKFTLGILVVLALATVFLLPTLITEPLIFNQADDDPVPQPASPLVVAPSTAAEKTKYRQDSQVMLAQIVAVRDRLLEQNVSRWGEVEFQQGLALIEAGDEQYNFGEYRASLDDYQQALDTFNALEQEGLQKLAQAKADGLDAIESLNTVVAAASSELASAIAPQDSQVQALASRAAQLPAVADLLIAGDQARERDRLQAAEQAYREAVRLDPQHRRAAASLAAINQDMTDAEFRGHMSRGMRALERGEFEAARGAFEQANGVHPGHAAVKQGLAQVENREALTAVNRKIARAAEFEAREEWRQAQEIYQELLDEDPSLTQARVKLIPAQVRADLDDRLQAIIDEPLQISSAAGYRDAQLALRDAQGIPNPGARLSDQIETMEELLVLAVSVVDVVFLSDNQTNVTVFRVAELGQFERKSLKLRPGRYIAAGTRQGFRDVRVEFTVTGRPLEAPIVVRCEEPI